MSPKTIADLLMAARNLKASSSPRLDIELLISHLLKKPRSWVIAHPEYLLTELENSAFEQMLHLRKKGEPIAYLLGRKEFWSQDYKVNRETLIPRPETELLIEATLELPLEPGSSVLDLGTGSGIIAISIKRERPDWSVFATDLSLGALAVASENCVQLDAPVSLVCSDWCSGLRAHSFDLIVSNPPYIEANDPYLQDLISEPVCALVAGADGLADLFPIISHSSELLKNGGYLLLEHGFEQRQAVCDKLRQEGYGEIRLLSDLNDLPRVCVARYTGHR